VEVVWWSLHEAVRCNHECAGLDDLVEFAEGYLEERQPFRLQLGEVYFHGRASGEATGRVRSRRTISSSVIRLPRIYCSMK